MRNKYKKWSWLKALWSPFKPFNISFYVGRIRIGVPYFLPRKFMKGTPKLIRKAVIDEIEARQKWNKSNPEHARPIKSFDELYREKENYRFAVPLKIGFSSCGLGWKTKWEDDDFRYEHGPVFSFVCFGWQIAIIVGFKDGVSHYWEAWLYYELCTDKNASVKERIEQCKKEFSLTWDSYTNGEKTTIDYCNKVLKKKWLC